MDLYFSVWRVEIKKYYDEANKVINGLTNFIIKNTVWFPLTFVTKSDFL